MNHSANPDARRRARPAWWTHQGIVARLRGSVFGDFLRRYTPIYRNLAELTDGAIAGYLAAAWGIWALGGMFQSLRVGRAAWLVGAPLGVVGLWVSVTVVAWWMSYRYSEDQLRHQLLGRRGVVAQGREVRTAVGLGKTLKKAPILRPTFTGRAAIHRAYALAPTMFPDHVASLLADAQAAGKRLDAAAEARLCEHLAANYRRTAAPWTPP